jgi:hypothetical protein
LSQLPVCPQFFNVEINPFPHKPCCSPLIQIAAHNVTSQIEHGLLSLVLSMDMRGIVFVKEHSDDDPEKSAYFWHRVSFCF